MTLVLRIHPLDPAWFGCKGQQYIADELTRLLVEADDWTLGVEGTFILVKNIL